MEKIKRFFECLLPVTACNLKCGYCYVIQRNNRKMEIPKLKYSSKIIGKGLTVERLGGVCYFSICGAGETLLSEDSVLITYELLKNGHFVNLTTNGTISKNINKIIQFPQDYLLRLNFSFSLHYNELKRLNLLDEFFKNIRKVKKAGCSFVLQINLCDEYIPVWDEIKELCISQVGAPPQVAATRKENNLLSDIELFTNMKKEDYIKKGKEYNSPLFDFTMENFNVKRKEFCYAGDWSGTLNLETGILSKCYGLKGKDIFKDIEKTIDFSAIGRCPSLFCMNSSHFLTLGVIPELCTPSYASIRDRECGHWYNPNFKEFLSQKLSDNNDLYSESKKKRIKRISIFKEYIKFIKIFLRK